MPLDVDAVVANQYIEKLSRLVGRLPHMKREQICDDIIEFVDKMEVKYNRLPKNPEDVPNWKPVPRALVDDSENS